MTLTALVDGQTKWTSYTPITGVTTNCTHTGYYRRIGSSVELRIKMAFTGASAGESLFPTAAQLLNGLGITLNTTIMPTSTNHAVGVWNGGEAASVGQNFCGVFNFNQDTNFFQCSFSTSTSSATSVSPAGNRPFVFEAGVSLSLFLTLPITEWQ